jgi:PAS domain S-box-containing protein
MTEAQFRGDAAGIANPSPGDVLRHGEEQLRLLVEAVQDYAIFMLDPSGNVATWNYGAERLKGYGAAEVIGRNCSVFYPTGDVEAGQPSRELATAVREGRYEGDAWRVRKDGSRFWANVVITAVRDAVGALVGFAKVTRDITERHRTTEQFRLAIEAAPTGMIMVDRAGRVVLVNAQVESLFGYGREELVGQSIELLVPVGFRGRHPGYRREFFHELRARSMGRGRDLHGRRKDASEVPIEVGLNPLSTHEGQFVLCAIVDITERTRAEREREDLMGQLRTLNTDLEARVRMRTSELTASLRERDVLLQEIHHRVKNNLQVVSSLIALQVRKLAPGTSSDALVGCQTRVQAIALVHEKLNQTKDYSRIAFSDYVRSLASGVFQATGASPTMVSLELAIGELTLGVDQAIPCGLLLNELISNALKHAFVDGRSGRVRVELAEVDGGRLQLAVRDDGVGLPEGLEVRTAESLGLQLVCALAQQLDAELVVGSWEGTSFQLTFPAET